MCGIYGIVDLQNPVDSTFLKKQGDRLSHRGPDDSGIWVSKSGGAGFAHRRLSIIDLSPAGRQPMSSSNGRYVIVFNGEVYNFKNLRAGLEKSGFRFKGGSDTEVILTAYEAWGEECLNRLNGMFAFAIYDHGDDNTAPSIFFARDRTGEKPFYYSHESHRFEFASELKAINIRTAIDPGALNYYLALGYVPAGLCLAKGVNKLPPAHAGRLDLSTFELKTWRYWELPENTGKESTDGEELADEVYALLNDSVKLRMISDVPLGVLLSGGLDSSLVTAVAAGQSSQPVKTFTIALPGSKLDESNYARSVADHFSTEHHVLEADKPSLSIIDELAPFIDEPIADSSIIPTFMVSRLTRQHVTVALGGDGGDELFGGYLHYRRSLDDNSRFGWMPNQMLKSSSRLADWLPAGVKGRNRIASLKEGPLQQMIWGSPYFDATLRKRLSGTGQSSVLDTELCAPELWLAGLFNSGSDPIDSMTRTDFGSVLPDDFLVKVDRASMAHSLEMRTPFLDHRLVEFAFSRITGRWKVENGETRRIERILAKRMLPHDLDIKRKQGFSIPFDEWLRVDNCQIMRRYMGYLPELIDRGEVAKLISGQMKGRANGSRLFSLLMLSIAMKNNGWS